MIRVLVRPVLLLTWYEPVVMMRVTVRMLLCPFRVTTPLVVLLLAVSFAVVFPGAGICVEPTLVWVGTYNASAANSDDAATAVAAEANGNYVVCGYETRLDLGEIANWRVAKYGPDNGLIWAKTYNSVADHKDEADAVAIDAAGNIFVAGYEYRSDVGQNENWLVIKYDANGNALWSRSCYGTGASEDRAYGVAADPSGSVYVAGLVNDDWQVVKYDGDGNELWAKAYNSPANNREHAYGIAVDGSGNAFVAGSEYRPDRGEEYNWLVKKYDPAGNVVWSRSFTSTGSQTESARGVGLDSQGNVFVGGYEGRLWRVAKYDPNGVELWARNYNNPTNVDNWAWALSVGLDDSVIIGGLETRTDIGQSYNWRAIKYDSAGNEIWSRNYNSPSNQEDVLRGIDVLPGGEVLLVGWERRNDLGQGTNWRIERLSAAAGPGDGLEDVGLGEVKIVGGIRGHIDPKQGERATILVKPDASGTIEVKIYSLKGRVVRVLNKATAGGRTEVLHWDGKDDGGAIVPPGLYPALIEAPGVKRRENFAVMR